MPYSEETTIAGASRGSAGAWHTWAARKGASRLDDVRSYLDTVYEIAPSIGLRAELIVTQSIHETSSSDGAVPWASHWWRERCNPAGIGITGDAGQNNASKNFENGRNAALAHIVHAWLYARGMDLPAPLTPEMDPRWTSAAIPAIAGKKTTIRSFGARLSDGPTWAADPDYGRKWVRTLNRLEDVIAAGDADGSTGQETPTVKPYILIVSGHRSENDPGDSVERELTDDLAVAYTRQFREAGYQADWWQRDLDQDDLPTSTRKGSFRKGLDAVAMGCARVLAGRPEALSIMLDLHFDGRSSRVHAVVPDVGNLTTVYADGAPRDDTAANNPLDVKLGNLIATRIVAANPGMTLYTGGRLAVAGCFSERDCNVATSYNARLAMFAATAKVRAKAIRLVIEHGGTDDARLPEFFERSAAAAVSAVREMFPVDGPSVQHPPADQNGHDDELDRMVAATLFGSVTVGTTTYEFNPDGPVTQQWLAAGAESGAYPRLLEVLHSGTRKYFQFSNGLVLWQPSETEALRQLTDLHV